MDFALFYRGEKVEPTFEFLKRIWFTISTICHYIFRYPKKRKRSKQAILRCSGCELSDHHHYTIKQMVNGIFSNISVQSKYFASRNIYSMQNCKINKFKKVHDEWLTKRGLGLYRNWREGNSTINIAIETHYCLTKYVDSLSNWNGSFSSVFDIILMFAYQCTWTFYIINIISWPLGNSMRSYF